MRDEPRRLLVVEDDPDIRRALDVVLSHAGFTLNSSPDGRTGLRTAVEQRPDLVILDVGLPEMDGWTVLERLRDVSDVPVLMLTARGTETDAARGLNSGADDYLAKPFGNQELVARVHALLRRARPRTDAATVSSGGVVVDPVGHRVTLHGRELSLTPTEYGLLLHLLRAEGRTLTPQDLLAEVWADPHGIGPERVKFTIHRLRRKLGPKTALWLQSVRGFGYRWREPPS